MFAGRFRSGDDCLVIGAANLDGLVERDRGLAEEGQREQQKKKSFHRNRVAKLATRSLTLCLLGGQNLQAATDRNFSKKES
jgi:hypothetical protein